MKTCPKCGQMLADNAKFCNNCGSSLPSSVQQAAQFCPNCGQKLTQGTAFCISCGAPTGSTGIPVPPQGPQSTGTRPNQGYQSGPGSQPNPGYQPTGARPNQGYQPNQGYRYAPGSVPPNGRAGGPQTAASSAYRAPQPDTFCPSCGERIPAGSAFCPNCHAPQAPGKNVKVRPNSGKSKAPIFAGIAVAVVALVVAGVLLIPRLFGSSPEETFVSAQEDIFVTPLLSAMETELDTYGSGKLSTDLTLSASVDSPEINQYLSNSSIVLKLDMDQDSLLAGGELNLMGSPVFSGTLTYEGGRLGFYLPELDGNYYVMDLSAMLSSLGVYGMDLSGIALPELSGKECRALAEAYLDILYSMVTNDNITVEKRQSYRLPQLGGSYTGTVYTFTPTAADVQAMMIKLADHLESDKDLRSLISKLMDSVGLQTLLSSYASSYGSSSYSSFDFDTAVDDALRELASQLRTSAQYLDQSNQDLGLTWKLYMEGKEVRMVRLESDYDYAMVFERAGSASKGCTQVFYQESYGEATVYLENEYTKSGDVYDGRLTANDGYGESVSLKYNADTGKRSVLGIPYGSYSLSAPSEDVSLSMTVSDGGNGSTDHVITIQDNGYAFGGEFSRLDLTINATEKSSAQKPSRQPTDITYYSEEELSDLMYYLSSQMEDALYGVMYGAW